MKFLIKRMNKTIRLFRYLYKSENRKTQILPVPAANERFHASGGAVSSDTEQVTSSFALVRAVAIPPPA